MCRAKQLPPFDAAGCKLWAADWAAWAADSSAAAPVGDGRCGGEAVGSRQSAVGMCGGRHVRESKSEARDISTTLQLTWKCTDPCRKTTFLLENAFLHFHVSWWEGHLPQEQGCELYGQVATFEDSRTVRRMDIPITEFRIGPVTGHWKSQFTLQWKHLRMRCFWGAFSGSSATNMWVCHFLSVPLFGGLKGTPKGKLHLSPTAESFGSQPR